MSIILTALLVVVLLVTVEIWLPLLLIAAACAAVVAVVVALVVVAYMCITAMAATSGAIVAAAALAAIIAIYLVASKVLDNYRADPGSPIRKLWGGSSVSERYARLAKKGNPKAQYAIGNLYQYGKEVQKDYVLAYAFYNLAAPKDSQASEDRDTIEANMSTQEIDAAQRLTRDWAKAGQFDKALDQFRNHIQQMQVSKECHHQNMVAELGKDPAPPRCKLWGGSVPERYARRAKKGSHKAQNALGKLYQYGEGVPKDYVLAYALYNLAAPKDSQASADRDTIEANMSTQEIDAAQRLTRALAKPRQFNTALDHYLVTHK